MDNDELMQEVQAQIEHDWTRDPATGRSNSSEVYNDLVREVGRIIRDSAYSLIAGQSDSVAGTIMARLAHVHGLTPPDMQYRVNQRIAVRGEPGSMVITGVVPWSKKYHILDTGSGARGMLAENDVIGLVEREPVLKPPLGHA